MSRAEGRAAFFFWKSERVSPHRGARQLAHGRCAANRAMTFERGRFAWFGAVATRGSCHVVAIGEHTLRGREASALPTSDSAHSQRNDGAQAAEALDGPRHATSSKSTCVDRQGGSGLGSQARPARRGRTLQTVRKPPDAAHEQARSKLTLRSPRNPAVQAGFSPLGKPESQAPTHPAAATMRARNARRNAAGKERRRHTTSRTQSRNANAKRSNQPRTPIAPAPRSEPFAPTRGRKSHANAPRRYLRWRHDLNEPEKSSRA